MPENETIALEQDLAWREKAMWLLLRRLGGEVRISSEEWESVPPLPELVISREGDVMVWTAREPASPLAAELDGQLQLPGTETRPWPYDGPEGRARLTGSLDTGGSFTGDDDDPEEQS